MPDAVSIIATIAAIKNSIDIVKAVKDADYDLDKAILKEKIAVLIDSLLEAKIQASEILDLLQEKDTIIAKLEDLLKLKSKLERQNGKYYEVDENGKLIGIPYCPRCWESEQKPIHLLPTEDEEDHFRCANCKNFFGKRKQLSPSSGYY